MRIWTVEDLGLRIRDERVGRGLSQAQLAALVGVSRAWIVGVERGKDGAEFGLVMRTLAALDLALNVRRASTDVSHEPGRHVAGRPVHPRRLLQSDGLRIARRTGHIAGGPSRTRGGARPTHEERSADDGPPPDVAESGDPTDSAAAPRPASSPLARSATGPRRRGQLGYADLVETLSQLQTAVHQAVARRDARARVGNGTGGGEAASVRQPRRGRPTNADLATNANPVSTPNLDGERPRVTPGIRHP